MFRFCAGPAIVAAMLGGTALSCSVMEGGSRHAQAVPTEGPSARQGQAQREPRPKEAAQPELAACATGLDSMFSSAALAPPAAGADSYEPPSRARRARLGDVLAMVARGRLLEAADAAREADYELCRTGDVAVLVPRDASHGHARVAVRLGPSRPVTLEAPHPFHDTGTAEQARELFERLEARALLVSGTHRCANAGTPSGHAGHTRVCGGRQPYAESDMAHNADTIFHRAHVSLFELYPDTVSVSLHGMAKRGVSVSNGTRMPILAHAEQAPTALFTAALQAELPDEWVTTCNPHAGQAARYRLCGTTNLQGRHANGYRASIVEPTRAGQRFVHLEQSLRVRRNIDAVAAAFDRWLRSLEAS